MGRKLKAQAVIFFIAHLATSALAQPSFTGKEFVQYCVDWERARDGQSYSQSNASVCFGYAVGVLEGVFNADAMEQRKGRICPVPGVTMSDAVRGAIRSLRGRPKDLSQPASALLVEAYIEAFPCRQ